LRKKLEDVVDLLSETTRQHLVGFIKNEDLHVIGLQDATLDHVVDTAGSANNDLWAILKCLHIVANTRTTDTSMALNAHEIANGDNNLLNLLSKLTCRGQDKGLAGLEVRINLLEDGDRECGGFASTRLSLSNDIVTWTSVSS